MPRIESNEDLPKGKKRCKYNDSTMCLGVDKESRFTGNRCIHCVRHMHCERYKKRVVAAGKTLVGRGRPKGAKDLKPRKNAVNHDSDSDSD
jgi:hypothetical protein